MIEVDQTGIERRKHPRRGFRLPGLIRGEWGAASATTVDLSAAGLSLRTTCEVPLGQALQGTLTAPGGRSLPFTGQVRWRQQMPGGRSERRSRLLGIELSALCAQEFRRFLDGDGDQDVTDSADVPEAAGANQVPSSETTEVPFAEPQWWAAASVAAPPLDLRDARSDEPSPVDVQGLRRLLEEKQSEVEALDRDNAALRLETEWLRAELAKRGNR